MDILGGPACIKCQFTDARALQIDHIDGYGGIERQSVKSNWSIIHRIVKMNPEEARKQYQVLCANCNSIKRWDNKEWAYQKTAYEVATGTCISESKYVQSTSISIPIETAGTI